MPNTSTNRTSAEPRQLPGTPCSTASRARAARQTCVQRRAALAGFITQNSCGGDIAAEPGRNDPNQTAAAAQTPRPDTPPLTTLPAPAGPPPAATFNQTPPSKDRENR